jgi:hypothetical protein
VSFKADSEISQGHKLLGDKLDYKTEPLHSYNNRYYSNNENNVHILTTEAGENLLQSGPPNMQPHHLLTNRSLKSTHRIIVPD